MVQIRRRRIFFIEGYEPQGADGFHRMFRREWSRFRETWGVAGKVDDIQLETDDIACWNIETSGPNWNVSTHYEFLRLEHQIRSNLAQPFWLQFRRTMRWMADDFVHGALGRVYRASWRMGVLLAYSQVVLLLWLALAAIGGVIGARALASADTSLVISTLIAAAIGCGIFATLRPVTDAMFVKQLNNCWPYLREFARGEPTGFDRSVEIFAERIVAATKAGDADEILVVGHSAGAMLALTIMRRALELDPDIGIRRPDVSLLTVGSITPIFSLHPDATKLRETVKLISTERSILWADIQAQYDFMNFWEFDPVSGVGIESGPARCNPLIWQMPFRDMISPQMYRKMRHVYWRKHYQYIMANERRATYDYFMFACGPAPFAQWAAQDGILDAFASDSAYRAPELKAAE